MKINKLLDYEDIKFEIMETSEGFYNIFSNELKVLENDVSKDKIEKYANDFNRKVELLKYEGFDLIDGIELSGGFKRIEYFENVIDGIHVYINKAGIDIGWFISGVKRHEGNDYICKVYCESLHKITNDVINEIVKCVKSKIEFNIKMYNVERCVNAEEIGSEIIKFKDVENITLGHMDFKDINRNDKYRLLIPKENILNDRDELIGKSIRFKLTFEMIDNDKIDVEIFNAKYLEYKEEFPKDLFEDYYVFEMKLDDENKIMSVSKSE